MKLNYKQLGHGQPLIILHGLFGSLDNWMTLAKLWSTNHRVILVDQRNHGKSPHSEEFSYSHMAEDLSELLNEMQIENPIILGHSMGGKTAMEFAVNYPERLEKLIVVDIAPVQYKVHHYTIISALEDVDLMTIKSRKEADEILKNKIPEIGIRQFLLKNLYWLEKESLSWRFNLEVIKRQIVPISEFAISNKLFEGPSLFIKGGKSEYILDDYQQNIEQKFPNYQLETIKGAGHWVHAEKREEFYKQVNQFL